MHQRTAFEPMDPSKLMPTERKKAMNSLTFSSEKAQVKPRHEHVQVGGKSTFTPTKMTTKV